MGTDEKSTVALQDASLKHMMYNGESFKDAQRNIHNAKKILHTHYVKARHPGEKKKN